MLPVTRYLFGECRVYAPKIYIEGTAKLIFFIVYTCIFKQKTTFKIFIFDLVSYNLTDWIEILSLDQMMSLKFHAADTCLTVRELYNLFSLLQKSHTIVALWLDSSSCSNLNPGKPVSGLRLLKYFFNFLDQPLCRTFCWPITFGNSNL